MLLTGNRSPVPFTLGNLRNATFDHRAASRTFEADGRRAPHRRAAPPGRRAPQPRADPRGRARRVCRARRERPDGRRRARGGGRRGHGLPPLPDEGRADRGARRREVPRHDGQHPRGARDRGPVGGVLHGAAQQRRGDGRRRGPARRPHPARPARAAHRRGAGRPARRGGADRRACAGRGRAARRRDGRRHRRADGGPLHDDGAPGAQLAPPSRAAARRAAREALTGADRLPRYFPARRRLQLPHPRAGRRCSPARGPTKRSSTEPMRRRLLVLSTALAGLLLLPGGAGADVGQFIPGERIDGPVTALSGLDVARDGTGALAYVKPDGGVDHVFVSRLEGGAWQAPERIDGGFPAPGSQPVVAAGDGGRLVVAFVSGGSLVALTKPGSGQPYTAPQLISSSGINPSIDFSINDVAYLSFTVPAGGGGGDVVVARKDRKASAFGVIPAALDIDPARQAGIGGGRSKVAVAADGVALVVWGEAGRVWARRVFERRLSTAPQDATVDAVGSVAGSTADLPDVDAQDDSSFAWVVYRETFNDVPGGVHARAVARRLVGSQFDPGVLVDGLGGFPTGDTVAPPRVDINGRGDGYAATAGTGTAFGAVLKDKKFNPGVPLGPGFGGQVLPAAAVEENGDGLVAWQNADLTIHARQYTMRRASRRVQAPEADRALSSLGGGPSDAADGLEASADRAGDVAVAFLQGPPGARSVVVASFDRAPGAFRPSSGTSFRNVAANPLKWTQSFELWGPLTYAVEVDGTVVGRTNVPQLAVPGLADGVHRWREVASDRSGDGTAPPPPVLPRE